MTYLTLDELIRLEKVLGEIHCVNCGKEHATQDERMWALTHDGICQDCLALSNMLPKYVSVK